jgi:CheY-like chemotaxis protein
MPSTRILVVEDYEPFLRFICSLLQQNASFEVIEAVDGLEAVQKARDLDPDILLIDIGLPKLNGLEAAKRIRQFSPDSKLLFVSQESDPDIVRETFRLGGSGYIHKAFVNDLMPAIQAVVSGARLVGNGLEFNKGADDSYRHAVQFYSDDSVFLNRAVRFVEDSLNVADGVILLATQAHQEGIAEKLKSDGCDIEGAMQRGTYISVDAAGTLSTVMVNGVPDPGRFFTGVRGLVDSIARAADREHPRIAIFGECVGLLHAEGNTRAALDLEKIGNDLVETDGVDIVCAYPWPHREDDQAFKSICAEHAVVHLR